MLSSDLKKQYRSIGHKLKPTVMIGGNGLSEAVISEVERALHDHELIKVKLGIADRDDRQMIVEELAKETKAEVVQMIGKMVLLYRANPKPNPKLSNVLRPH
ncbi:ribosome assembly RNA-binding protein YhbY [Aurantivibrio plasticivorans]